MRNHQRRVTRVAVLAILTNTLLVIGKLLVGLHAGSISVLSEAAHSGVDLVVAVLAWAAIRYAQLPADRTHPYGHGKVETLTSFGEGLLIYGVAGYIIWHAIDAILGGSAISDVRWGIAVMVGSALINLAVSRYLLRVGKESGSPALEATGLELGTDVVTASGVVVGLFLFVITGWRLVDPILGLVVSAFILVTGTRVLVGAVRGLMDYRLPDEEESAIRNVLNEHADTFIEYHDLRTRHVGSSHAVDLHLVVPKDMSVAAAHDLSTHLEGEIADVLPQADVVIHVEPEDEAVSADRANGDAGRTP